MEKQRGERGGEETGNTHIEGERERERKPAAANEPEQRGGRGRNREKGRWRGAPSRREGYRVRKK